MEEQQQLAQFSGQFGNAINMMAKPELDTVLERMQKVAQSERSSHITEREKGAGFSELFVSVTEDESEIKAEMYDDWIKFLEHSIEIPDILRPTVTSWIRGLRFEVKSQKHIANFCFSNGKGSVTVFRMILKKLENGNTYSSRVSFESSFKLAPNMIIIRHNKKNWLSSESWDEITYHERGFTEADMLAIINVTSGLVGTCNLALASKNTTPALN